MAEPGAQRELDALVELARHAEPPPLGTLEARRVVRHARAAALRHGQRRRLGNYGLLCAAALLALIAGYVWQRAPAGTTIAVGALERPLRVALKTGDSLLLAPGSELALLEQRATRGVRLTRGRVLLEVAKLGAGEGFEVQTESARVRVLGTIFSVEVGEGRTLVRVYEGRVAVDGGVLAAPGAWVSRGAPPQQGDALFDHEARQLVRARQAAQRARLDAPAAQAESLVAPGRAAPPVLLPAMSRSSAPVPRRSPEPAAGPGAPAGAAADSAAASRAAESAVPSPSASAASPTATRTMSAPAAEIDRARALLAAGDARGALEYARQHALRDDEALLLTADASRALGRHREAREAYLGLARRSADPLRARAAFAAAQLALHAQRDAADALSLIATFALNAERAPLRERATALEVDALLALGRRRDACAAAKRYLAREPETETSRRMRELIGE